MADEVENVEYRFTGDVDSLEKAAKKSIKILEKYGDVVKLVAEAGDFTISEQSMKKFNSQLEKAIDPSTQLLHIFKDFQRTTKNQLIHSLSNPAYGDAARSIDFQIDQKAKQSQQFSARLKAQMDKTVAAEKQVTKKAEELAKLKQKQIDSQPNVLDQAFKSKEQEAKSFSEKLQQGDVFGKYYADRDVAFGGAISKLNKVGKVFGKEFFENVTTANQKIISFGLKLNAVVVIAKIAGKVVKKMGHHWMTTSKHMLKFATTPLRMLTNGVEKLSRVFKLSPVMSQLFGIGLGAAAGRATAKATKNAANMAEAYNLFKVAMDDAKEGLAEGNKFIANLSETAGLDPTTLHNTTGMFYEMAAAIDMPSKAARKMSMDLTEVSLDLASLFNYDFKTVADNMTSGIRGMSRAVLKYGIDIRATTVEAFAKSKFGITEQFETMSEVDREILRYLLILDQVKDAQGDLANTIPEPANQFRIFKEQVVALSRQLGRFVVNVLRPALPIINGVTMALRLLTQFIADAMHIWSGTSDYTGKKKQDDLVKTSSGISGIGDAAKSSSKALKELVAPFDELNILSREASRGGGIGGGGAGLGYGVANPKLLQALYDANTGFKKVEMAAHKTRDAVLKFFGFEYVFDPEKSTDKYIQMISGGFADKLSTAFREQDYSGVGQVLADKFNEVLAPLPFKFSWENLGPGIESKLTGLFDGINSFIKNLHWKDIGATFGNLVKTTFETINFAGLSFDWSGLGAALSSTISSFIQHADLSVAGTAIANWLNGIADFAANFSQEFDWHAFGETLASTVNNFFKTWNISKLLEAAISIINGLLDTADTFLKETGWDEIGDSIAQALEDVHWDVALAEIAGKVAGIFKDLFIAKLVTKNTILTNMLMGKGFVDKMIADNTAYHVEPTQRVSGGSYLPAGVRPHMATGGVVTRPTTALIGEAGRAEAVIPLDNSPQMNDFINKVAAAADNERVVNALYTLIDVVNAKDTSVYIGDDDIGHSYDRYRDTRGATVNSGAFANAY